MAQPLKNKIDEDRPGKQTIKYFGKGVAKQTQTRINNVEKEIIDDLSAKTGIRLTEDMLIDLKVGYLKSLRVIWERGLKSLDKADYTAGKLIKVGAIDKIFGKYEKEQIINTIYIRLEPKLKDLAEYRKLRLKQTRTAANEVKLLQKQDDLTAKYNELDKDLDNIKDELLNYTGTDLVDATKREILNQSIRDIEKEQKNIKEKIAILDKKLSDELRQQERDQEEAKREQNKLILEKKKKYKKMTAESNRLAEEIQKTIARVAAEGYSYAGRGMKKKPVKKVKKRPVIKEAASLIVEPEPIKQKLYPSGGKFHESPAEEVAYILDKLANMLKKGDLEHIDLVAKKLRKAKKIGKGKYYLFEDEYEGEGYPTGGKQMKKKKRGGELSFKQKVWRDEINKVRAKHPNLSYKEAMQIASEKRNKKKHAKSE